jgi:hypothetical protein
MAPPPYMTNSIYITVLSLGNGSAPEPKIICPWRARSWWSLLHAQDTPVEYPRLSSVFAVDKCFWTQLNSGQPGRKSVPNSAANRLLHWDELRKTIPDIMDGPILSVYSMQQPGKGQ